MKISELQVQDYLAREAGAEANSYIILNYGTSDSGTPITYRVSLAELSKMIINNHNLLRYSGTEGDKNLTSVKYASNDYSITDSIGQFIDATDRTVLNNAVTNVGYDTTEKQITFSTRGGTAASVVTAATLKTDMALNKVNNTSDAEKPVSTAVQEALNLKMNSSARGAVSGVASLDENGKVPASQLPSYVDDVIEGYYHEGSFYTDSNHSTPITGESGKIYIDLTSNGARQVYRWGGTTYAPIPIGLALGNTSTTAYWGDKGAQAYSWASDAYAHAVTNKGIAKSSGLYKITTNSEGHITAATAVEKSDITALGIPGSDTTYAMDGTYNASTNKVATVATVTNAVNGLLAIPALPAEDGTYNLQVTISSGTPTYSWVPVT